MSLFVFGFRWVMVIGAALAAASAVTARFGLEQCNVYGPIRRADAAQAKKFALNEA